jgi:2-polyprenyl-3-methyl-5-hydroxy-6-metoxy-1,4-benzoquinol methylase
VADVALKFWDATLEDREFKAGQRATWAQGDYHEFARRSLWGFGQELVEACGIGPGQRVLDVAAGSGNVAIRAAQAGADVVASDLTPENFEDGQREAAAEGVLLEWVEADAEALPFADGEFDVVTSAFGAVFAPDQQAVADELVRVCRPGGTIGLTAPSPPADKVDHVRMMSNVVPAMFGAVSSPLQWGDETHVAGLFGERIEGLEMGRLRSELGNFAGKAELRDFLKTHHPVAVALYRELGDDPELAAAFDGAFLGMIDLWYARDEDGSGTFAQEAVMIVARKRRVVPGPS